MKKRKPIKRKPTTEKRWIRPFLTALAQTGNITRAAKAAKIDRTMPYIIRAEDEEFRKAMQEALEKSTDALEEEARRRAHDGCMRYKFDAKGRPLINPETGEPYVEYEYSDTLLIFLLKALRPDKYRERLNIDGKLNVEHSGWLGFTTAIAQRSNLIESLNGDLPHEEVNGTDTRQIP